MMRKLSPGTCPCGKVLRIEYNLAIGTTKYQHGDNPEAVLVFEGNRHDAMSGYQRLQLWLQSVHEYEAGL